MEMKLKFILFHVFFHSFFLANMFVAAWKKCVAAFFPRSRYMLSNSVLHMIRGKIKIITKLKFDFRRLETSLASTNNSTFHMNVSRDDSQKWWTKIQYTNKIKSHSHGKWQPSRIAKWWAVEVMRSWLWLVGTFPAFF